MAKNGDYLPTKETDLVDWVANFVKEMTANANAWQIPAEEIAAIQQKGDLFRDLHMKCAGADKTEGLVSDKNAAKRVLKSSIRKLVNFRFSNPIITDSQRIQCGLHAKDQSRTTIAAPKSRPEFGVKVTDLRRIKIDFRDQGSNKAAKPYGISGAVISYAVLPAPPAEPSELSRAFLATRTPCTLEFTEEERGRTVYIALQWQNNKGQKGAYSEIQSALIP